MIKSINKEWSVQVTIAFFIVLTIWWIILKFTVSPEDLHYQIFAATYGLMALWGGIWGISISKKWGGSKSLMGKAILMFSLGLLAQEFGQIAYSYYIYFARIEVPYPSIGDIGYFGSIPLYTYGVLLMAKASGVKLGLQAFMSKIQAIFIPILILGFSYLFFLQGYIFDWSQPLVVFLDFGYPMGQAVYISFAILTYLLSRKVLGGIMRSKILFIIFALAVQYFADYTFLYQANRESWYPGGINDYIYLVAYFIMTLGLFRLKTALGRLRETNN